MSWHPNVSRQVSPWKASVIPLTPLHPPNLLLALGKLVFLALFQGGLALWKLHFRMFTDKREKNRQRAQKEMAGQANLRRWPSVTLALLWLRKGDLVRSELYGERNMCSSQKWVITANGIYDMKECLSFGGTKETRGEIWNTWCSPELPHKPWDSPRHILLWHTENHNSKKADGWKKRYQQSRAVLMNCHWNLWHSAALPFHLGRKKLREFRRKWAASIVLFFGRGSTFHMNCEGYNHLCHGDDS